MTGICRCQTCGQLIRSQPDRWPETPVPAKTRLEHLPIDTRTLNVLHTAGIQTVGDLLKHKPSQMMREPNFGKRSLRALRDVLVNGKAVYARPAGKRELARRGLDRN